MKESKVRLISAIVGGILGYLILSPVSMLISDKIHAKQDQAHLVRMYDSAWISISESFSPQFATWAISYSVVGLILGLAIGILFLNIIKGNRLLLENSTKRIDALENFRDESQGWRNDVDKLKSEVNELLKQLGQDTRY